MMTTKHDVIADIKIARDRATTVTVTRNRFGYEIAGGGKSRKLRRVTTLLSGLPKPALVGWAAREVAEFAIEHKEEWANLPKADALKLLKGSPYSKRDAAGDRGSAIHAALEAVVDDTPLPEGLTEDEDACAAAAMGFLGDLGGTFLATELTVFNFTVGGGYAGTLDLWHLADDGTTSVIDWKSSKGIYADHGVQQAAYANAEWALVGAETNGKEESWEGKLIPWKKEYSQKLSVCHVEPTGTTLHTVRDPEKLWKIFQAAAYIKGWQLDTDSYRGKEPREEVYETPIHLEA
jgi:hypothetical protein